VSQQPPKKPGSRDINDLKARLGIKKGAAPVPEAGGTTPPPPTGRSTAAIPAVMPPPGLMVPSPMGATQAPPQPVIPNAAEDPFGAMNAMAQMGTAQRAPEIVFINDGKPVENVGTGSTVKIVIGVVGGLMVLALGVAIGSTAKGGTFYNEGITASKGIRADVKSVKKTLVSIKEKVDKAQGQGKDSTAALRELEKLEPKDALVYRAKQNNLNPELEGQILGFYAGVKQLRLMIEDHLTSAKADDAALGAARAATEKMTFPANQSGFENAVRVRYGVLVWNPTEEEATKDSTKFGARLVEIGPPFCSSDSGPKLSASGTCPEGSGVETLAYRVSSTGQWLKGDFAIPGQNLEPGAPVPPKKLLIISPTSVFDGLALGSANSAAEALYNKRVEAISARLTESIEAANALEARLGPKANESPHFTFFL